ncbi:beta strand repeat-containing protein [Euzebyella saccharophila]
MNNLKKFLGLLFLFLINIFGNAQQTTNWTSVSSTVWESFSSDGLVRVECRVTGGVSILGNETMGCVDASTYSDPSIFGSNSLEIEVNSFNAGTLTFNFFDATTGDPVFIVQPILHVDKVGTISVVPLLSGTATANFNLNNGTWTEISSNGPIFNSTPTLFNIDDNALLLTPGGECNNGVDQGTGGGSMRLNHPRHAIAMNVNMSGGLLSLLNAQDEVEFVLSDLIIAEPSIEATKTVTESYSAPVSAGDQISYEIEITNTGNVTLNNISLNDTFTDVDGNTLSLTSAPSHTNSTMGSPDGTLQPNEVATYIAGYTMVTNDLLHGGFLNQVTVTADSPYGPADTTDISDDGLDSDDNTENDVTESYFPVPIDDTANTDEDNPVQIDVVVNDDFSGNGLATNDIFLVSTPSNGTVALFINGTPNNPLDDYFVYTPATDFSGTDTFNYGIMDGKGYIGHATVNVTINSCPEAGLNSSLQICEGSTPSDSDLFNALGGSPDTGGTWTKNPSGSYTYSITGTAPCSSTSEATVFITEQASPNAGTDGTLTICEGETVTEAQLFAQLGNSPDTGGTWSPALAGAGTYTYTVVATSPCSVDDTSEVVVTEQAAPNAGTDGTLTICEGEIVTEAQLFAQLGNSPDSGGTWSPALAGAGTYTYTVAATSPCTVDETSEVVVTAQAVPNAGTDGTLTICDGETVTEAQLFARLGNSPDSGGTWSPALAGAGTYIYTVAATSPCTTDDTSEVVVTAQANPNAGTDGTLTICEGETVTEAQLFAQLGNSPDSGGTWSPALASAGTYIYTVAAISPCTVDDTSEVVVTAQAAPNAGTDGTLTICEGETVTEAQLFAQLGNSPDSGGTWSPALAGAGTYTYTVAATSPCTVDDTSEVVVTAQATPNAGTDGTLTICEGETVTEAQLFVQLGNSPDSGGTWSPALAGAGTYTYTVPATSPCTVDETSEVAVIAQAAPNAGTDGTLTICEGETITEAQLFAQLGNSPDSGGTWSPALAGAGTYTYTVTATSPCSVDDTSEVVVIAQAAPNAGTDGTLTICDGETVTEAQLFAQLGNSPDSGGAWSPALAGAGTYTYTVTATSPCSVDDTSEVVVIAQAAPNAGTDGTLTICDGETVTEAQLFAQLGNSPDSGGAWSPALAGAGTYTYTVTATSPCTTDDTSEVVVTAQAAPNAGTDGTLTICEGETVTEVQLFAQLGNSPDSGGTWSPALAGAGTYTYTVAATSPCTTDDISEVIVTSQANPNAGTDGNLTICDGETVTEAQLFAQLGNSPDSGGTWSPALSGAGTYTYTVTATSPCTTDDTSEVVVTAQAAPNAGTDGTLTICEGETITEAQLFAQLGNSPDSGGAWSPALAGAGTYTYTVTATSPCTTDDTSEVVVTAQAAPNAGTDGTLTICEGETVTEVQLFAKLGNSPDSGGTWSPALAGAGTYTYTVAATSPCTTDDTSEVVVTAQANPNAGTDGTLTICEGETVTEAQLFAQLGNSPNSGGTWSPALAGTGTYTYSVAGNACTNSTSQVEVFEEKRPDAGTSITLELCMGEVVSTNQLFNLLQTTDTRGSWNPNPEGASEGSFTYSIPGTICSSSSATITIIQSNLDSDGDTVLDCQENIDGTDPTDDCNSLNGMPLPQSDCDND